jgi:hypothetical protein
MDGLSVPVSPILEASRLLTLAKTIAARGSQLWQSVFVPFPAYFLFLPLYDGIIVTPEALLEIVYRLIYKITLFFHRGNRVAGKIHIFHPCLE